MLDALQFRASATACEPALFRENRSPFCCGEFWAETTTIADALYDAGIQRGDVVAVALPDGPELIASFVGASRVAACAPLNVALHVSELTAGRSYERRELACNVVQFLGADEVHSKGAACA